MIEVVGVKLFFSVFLSLRRYKDERGRTFKLIVGSPFLSSAPRYVSQTFFKFLLIVFVTEIRQNSLSKLKKERKKKQKSCNRRRICHS